MFDEQKQPLIALILRMLGYICMFIGIVVRPLDGALIVVGIASIVEGFILTK